MPAKPEPQGVACEACGVEFTKHLGIVGTCQKYRGILDSADRMAEALDDIEYIFTNIWALDRKKFEEQFLTRIKEALAAYRLARNPK